ncbi:MAG: transcription elongation factor GreAB [Gammaproteobacteria bacterium]|nr:MAG: transcription elongation factor GreAB [Gammaproteobacteria bacterium]
MSRAFVKEADGEQAETDLPDRPVSPGPNYVTPRGLRLLQSQVEQLRSQLGTLKDRDDLEARNARKQIERDLRYFETQLRRAIPVPPPPAGEESVRFGATVTLRDEEGKPLEVTLVGEDEADPARGLISWSSPLGRELIGKGIGDEVRWRRPAGEQLLEIESVRYPVLENGDS